MTDTLALPFSSPPFNFLSVPSITTVPSSPNRICHDNPISSVPDPPSLHTISNVSQVTSLPVTVASDHAPANPPFGIITRSQTGHSKPRNFPDYQLHYATRHPLQALHAGVAISKPRNYGQAAAIPEWQEPMASEFQALLKNETWSLCPCPTGKNVVPCKWVFKLKRKLDGSIYHHKARLVAVGYFQRSGIDFHETFSPVIKPSTMRMVLATTVSFN